MSGESAFTILGWGDLPGALCRADVLARVRRCGINVVMLTGPASELASRLDAVGEAGLGALVFESEFTRHDNADWRLAGRAMVDAVRSHPAVRVVAVMDEPSVEHFAAVRDKMRFVQDHLPQPVYVNAYGFGRRGAESYRHYVEQYMDELAPPFLSFDHYPICRIPPSALRNVTYNYDDDCGFEVAELGAYYRSGYFGAWEICRLAAECRATPLWGFVLAAPHQHTVFNYGPVTEGTIRLEAYTALAHGCHAIQYFTLLTQAISGYQDGIIDSSGEPSARYDAFARVNREIAALGPLVRTLNCHGVYYTGQAPPGCPRFTAVRGERDTAHYPLVSLVGDPLMISFFRGPDDSRYMMLVNRHPVRYAAAKMTFCDGYAPLEIVKAAGAPVSQHKTRDLVGLEAGEGKLYRLQTSRTNL